MHARNDDSEVTNWLGVVFEDNPEVFESQVVPNPNRQKPKVTPNKLWSSPWGELLLNPETQDPTPFLGKKWITRFRVPFPVFQQIVEECKESILFNMKRKSYSVPVEFRVLIALRILAKNYDCDTLNELSLVGASTFLGLLSLILHAYTLSIWYLCQRASNCGRPWISTRFLISMDASDQLIALTCVGISALENGRTSA